MRIRGAIYLENGALATPSVSFVNSPNSGLFLNAAGDMRMSVAGAIKVTMTDDGANGGVGLFPRGTGVIALNYGLTAHLSVGSTGVSMVKQSSPATPPANRVSIYARTDGKLYSKDDAGTETALSGGGAAVDTDSIEFLAMWGAFA